MAGAVVALAVLGCTEQDDAPADPATGPAGPTVPTTGPEPAITALPGTGTRAVPDAPTRPAPGGAARVVRVVDGDTLEVRLRSGRVESVRLVGINAPESGECLSARATARLGDLVGAGPLRLERDESDRDQYGRLLRHVYAADRWVNEALVDAGLAVSRAYPPDTNRQAALDAAQARAQAAERGQWAPDACGPAATARIRVGTVRTDPPGDESITPNEEWIEVVNAGGQAVDLTGWGIRDESASNRFSFPPGFRLGPGATVRIRTGCGADNARELHWCSRGSAVWNNDGDTVFVTDPSGNVVARRAV